MAQEMGRGRGAIGAVWSHGEVLRLGFAILALEDGIMLSEMTVGSCAGLRIQAERKESESFIYQACLPSLLVCLVGSMSAVRRWA